MITRSAIDDIMAERMRQTGAEGWSTEHDDTHKNDELARLACFYANPVQDSQVYTEMQARWGDVAEWVKHKDRRSDLVRAAALIVAEIERLDRAEAAKAA